ncbi:copper-binding protein [Oleiharenicola lentus]|uniref:Copper-binding protein n=1 Tax=Oleiharenicola lentus TaxID=2508720 RepID=A0A4Q1C8E3_9BACT|nr:copper-binding protein [Oleiharenicola lentus]RXK55116.1 copper-binding protein [Oleiharenicola lentus]
MKTVRLILALLAIPAALFAGEKSDDKAKNCGCGCCKGKKTCCCNTEASADDAKPEQAKRYPLKGVIVDILAEKSALLVKHEEIPGYMMAMTMLFQVDAATLKAAVKGQAITGTLVEKTDGFWLEDMKPAK